MTDQPLTTIALVGYAEGALLNTWVLRFATSDYRATGGSLGWHGPGQVTEYAESREAAIARARELGATEIIEGPV